MTTAPRKYTEALGRRVCDLIAEGESFNTIEKMPGMPRRRTLRSWVERDEAFARQYQIAREAKIDNMVDELVDITDAVIGSDSNAAVAAARLKVDTIKWLAARVISRKYGDRVEHVGADGEALIPVAIDPHRVAVVLLNILTRSRLPAEDIDEDDEPTMLEPALEPRRLTPPPEEPAEAVVMTPPPDAAPRTPPPPRWSANGDGRLRHTSELQAVTK